MNSTHTIRAQDLSDTSIDRIDGSYRSKKGDETALLAEAQVYALLSIAASLRDVADAIRNGGGQEYNVPEQLAAVAEQLGSISGALYSDPRRSQ